MSLTETHPRVETAWSSLKGAVTELREFQIADGSIPDVAHHARAGELVDRISTGIRDLAPEFPTDADYLDLLRPADWQGYFGANRAAAIHSSWRL